MKRLVILLLISLPLCAMASDAKLTEEQVLAVARVRANGDCHNGSLMGKLSDYKMVSCDFSANFDGKEWNVFARHVYKNAGGEEIVPDAATIYVFSPSGRFLQKLPGE
jgi:hypothetical protein